MPIDFTDPAQMMHGGKRIPIDTIEAFTATRDAARAVYLTANEHGHVREWDADADEQLERRVLNGATTADIITRTLEDRKARFDE